MTKNRPNSLIIASATAVALSSVALGGGMEKTPILEKSPIVAPESDCACPWGFSAAALYLKAHHNEGGYDQDQEEELGYRVALSYKCDDNLGIRLRYFQWEGSNDWYPEMSAIDLEVFDDFELGEWQGEISFGLRYATFEESMDETDFDGWGPTLGLEMTRQISGPFSLYAGARASLVYGDAEIGDGYGDTYDMDDSFVPIIELSGGIQYTFNAFGSCDSYIRLGLEAQNWQSISYGDNEDSSLFGGALEVGLAY
ncbi:MAG: Lpg1974 family pore-forming outer membrane protein [Verrucomicrobia bacterium]|nr:Lpg1974 family pore-forming outer membrane protein [Verrucomicrobiota bacterium]